MAIMAGNTVAGKIGAGAVAESASPIRELEAEGIWVRGGLLKAQSHTCPNKAITSNLFLNSSSN